MSGEARGPRRVGRVGRILRRRLGDRLGRNQGLGGLGTGLSPHTWSQRTLPATPPPRSVFDDITSTVDSAANILAPSPLLPLRLRRLCTRQVAHVAAHSLLLSLPPSLIFRRGSVAHTNERQALASPQFCASCRAPLIRLPRLAMTDNSNYCGYCGAPVLEVHTFRFDYRLSADRNESNRRALLDTGSSISVSIDCAAAAPREPDQDLARRGSDSINLDHPYSRFRSIELPRRRRFLYDQDEPIAEAYGRMKTECAQRRAGEDCFCWWAGSFLHLRRPEPHQE